MYFYLYTAIIGLDIRDSYLAADPDKLVLEVKSLKENAARSSFDLHLSYLDDSIAGGDISEYTRIGLSVIMIGSDFDGSSTTI